MCIRKRKIFYISGFDPRGIRFYRQILKKAVSDFSSLSGEEVCIQPNASKDPHEMRLINSSQGTENDYHFLAWDDIVRQHWIRNPLILLIETLKAYYGYGRFIMWSKVPSLPRGPVRTLFFPIVTLLSVWIILGLLIGMVSFWMTENLSVVLGAVLLALLPTAYILERIKSLWLLRFFIFNVKAFDTQPNFMDSRLSDFARTIQNALNNPDYDEVQVLAHSNGSILLMPLLYHLFSSSQTNIERLKILTLGQCIPLASYYQRAFLLRDRMDYVKQYPFIWMDLGAPSDGVCFPLHHPFKPYEEGTKTKILMKSPQFHKYFPKADYQKLSKNKFEIHFEYLKTSPILSPLNIVRLMTSNASLETHFMDQPPE